MADYRYVAGCHMNTGTVAGIGMNGKLYPAVGFSYAPVSSAVGTIGQDTRKDDRLSLNLDTGLLLTGAESARRALEQYAIPQRFVLGVQPPREEPPMTDQTTPENRAIAALVTESDRISNQIESVRSLIAARITANDKDRDRIVELRDARRDCMTAIDNLLAFDPLGTASSDGEKADADVAGEALDAPTHEVWAKADNDQLVVRRVRYDTGDDQDSSLAREFATLLSEAGYQRVWPDPEDA